MNFISPLERVRFEEDLIIMIKMKLLFSDMKSKLINEMQTNCQGRVIKKEIMSPNETTP